LSNILRSFAKIKALVVGDVMLDTYLFGTVNRISPEAPVPIVDIERKESRPGGAANVAMNIAALGGKAVVCSAVGKDEQGEHLLRLLGKNSLLSDHRVVVSSKRITTEKTRIFSRNHQMLRYDHETNEDLSSGDEKKLLDNISHLIKSQQFNVVILQDYNKGVLTPAVIHSTIALSNKKEIPVTVDPKRKNFFEYRDVTLFKPNLREVSEALNIHIDKQKRKSLEQAAQDIHSKLRNHITLITLSESGVFITNHQHSELIPATVRHVADVSGAGDTVLSVASLCIASGFDFKTTGRLANIAGGLACARVGVNPISRDEFFEEARPKL